MLIFFQMFDCASIGYAYCEGPIVVCMNPRWGICMPCASCPTDM